MSDPITPPLPSLAASLLHLRSQGLTKGEPIAEPLVLSATYQLPGEAEGFPGYGRVDNPVWEAYEAAISHLEQAESVVFPSGMGAISAALFATLRAGDRLLLPSDGYYTTRLLAERFLKGLGITIDLRPTASFAEGGFAGYRLVFAETPSNPGLDLCDLATIAAEVHPAGGLLVVDNTTMTPYGQRPLDLGADLVVAGDTKAPSGHSDVLLGHVSGRDADLMARVRDWRKLSGAIPGPFECWQVLKGLETLELRFDRMCSTALFIAERLETHPKVRALSYPGLASHKDNALAQKQMLRTGFLIGLTLKDDAAAEAFLAACPLLVPATSFGSAHTSGERRSRWGDQVAPGFLRLSIGIEPAEALWAAFDAALTQI